MLLAGVLDGAGRPRLVGVGLLAGGAVVAVAGLVFARSGGPAASPVPAGRIAFRLTLGAVALVVLGLLWNSVPFTLFAFGETHISSVLAGIINAATPLTTLAVILDKQRPDALAKADYTGFTVGNDFVVGYGMDDAGHYRTLPYIGRAG